MRRALGYGVKSSSTAASTAVCLLHLPKPSRLCGPMGTRTRHARTAAVSWAGVAARYFRAIHGGTISGYHKKRLLYMHVYVCVRRARVCVCACVRV